MPLGRVSPVPFVYVPEVPTGRCEDVCCAAADRIEGMAPLFPVMVREERILSSPDILFVETI